MLTRIFLQVLNMSLTASTVILAVLLARALLKKAPKVFSYALWSVVLFRLLCPFSFESVFSLIPSSRPLPETVLTSPAPALNSGIPAVDRVVRLPAAPVGASANPMQIILGIAAALWLIGVLVLLAYSLVSTLRLCAEVRCATPLRENIYEIPTISTPFVFGLIHPRIYLPAGLTEAQQRYILLHEQTHIHRGDHLLKALAFLAVCIHWFNPLVWLAFFQSSKDMELSCDEKVLDRLGSEVKKEYSASLLSLSAPRHIVGGTPLAFGEGDVKSRIKHVLSYKHPAFWVIAAALVSVAALIVVFAADPRKDDTLGQPVQEKIMASLVLENGTEVRLVLTDGRTFSGEEAGLGGDTYQTNFRGSYELQALQNGEVRSRIGSAALQPLAFDGETLNFPGTFDLTAADYNGDGDLDFALGQFAGSSLKVYMLFSVDRAGQLRILPIENGQEPDLFTAAGSFSPYFEQPSTGTFAFEGYDNAAGLSRYYTAVWDGSAFQVTERLPSPDEFVNAIAQSFFISQEGEAQFTVPSQMPQGYAPEQITAHVSGTTPMGEGSQLSLHAFEESSLRRIFQPGQTYTEQMFDGQPADGTVVYATFYLMEPNPAQEGAEMSSHYATVSKAFPLRDESSTPSVEVNAAGRGRAVIFKNSFGDQLRLDFTLPAGWDLSLPSEGDAAETSGDPVQILKNGEVVGELFYSDFDLYRDENGDIPYLSVYNSLMLGSMASWDNEYTEVQKNDLSAVATCRPWHKESAPGVSNAAAPTIYSRGILAYDAGLQKYIALNIADGAMTEKEFAELAQSIRLSGSLAP